MRTPVGPPRDLTRLRSYGSAGSLSDTRHTYTTFYFISKIQAQASHSTWHGSDRYTVLEVSLRNQRRAENLLGLIGFWKIGRILAMVVGLARHGISSGSLLLHHQVTGQLGAAYSPLPKQKC